MEFTEVIRRRRMIRAFTTEPLPEGLTDRLLAAAARAPSAGFSQGFSFLELDVHEVAAALRVSMGLLLRRLRQVGVPGELTVPATTTAISGSRWPIPPRPCSWPRWTGRSSSSRCRPSSAAST